MYKEAKNLKPGDRVTWTSEFVLEIMSIPRIDNDGCRVAVQANHTDSFEEDEDGNKTILLSSPKTRLRYLGNITDIEQQIRQLTEQKAKLQARPVSATQAKQSPAPSRPAPSAS